MATVKAFHNQGLCFHGASSGGPQRENWCGALSDIARCCGSSTIHGMPEPLYSGGTILAKQSMAIVRSCAVPQDEWETLIPGAHAGYLSWEDYEQNQKRLHESAQAIGADRRRSPAREGPALLQGLVVCGRAAGA